MRWYAEVETRRYVEASVDGDAGPRSNISTTAWKLHRMSKQVRIVTRDRVRTNPPQPVHVYM